MPFDQKDTKRYRKRKDRRKKGKSQGKKKQTNWEKDGLFRDFLKEAVVVAPLIMAGRLFHRRGAEDENALSPVRVCVFGT